MVPTLSSQPRYGFLTFEKGLKNIDTTWGAYRMPLTPPSSPVFYGSSPGDDDFDCCFRIQPICGIYDDIITEEHAYAQASGLDFPIYSGPKKSVVIKDCMWGHWSSPECQPRQQENEGKPKEEGTVQLPENVDDTMESSAVKLVGVDPTEVFPHHDDPLRMQNLSDCTDSDDDSDIDVVTVESAFPPVVDMVKPQSPELLTPPKTPETDQGYFDIKQTIKARPTQSPCKVKGDTSQALVEKTLSLISERQTVRSPRKQSSSSGELKYSRTSHNVLERKRRNELKMRFYNLRDAIPELTDNEKVPKVTILKQAITYLKTLKREETVLLAEQQRQRKQNAELRKKVAQILHRS